MSYDITTTVRLTDFTPGKCENGLYVVTGETRVFNILDRTEDDYPVEVIDRGFIGWPGVIFVRIDFGQGHSLSGFANDPIVAEG
jgi:hypothetical protein